MTNSYDAGVVMTVAAIRERAARQYTNEDERDQELADIWHLLGVIEQMENSPEIVIEA